MANIAQNITEISKIIGCSEQFYKAQSNKTDPYYESTMYLVNNGEFINSQQGYLSDADYPHVDLPDFHNLIRGTLAQGYINFIVYVQSTEQFYLVACNSKASQYCSVSTTGTDLHIYTNLYHCNQKVYTYSPSSKDTDWTQIANWTYDVNIPYTESAPFKVVWAYSNFDINYQVSDTIHEIVTYCPSEEDADPKNNKYFARFYDTSGTYLNNDIYVREDLAYTDLYYGARKLTDTLICQNYPDDPAYPNDKIYLQPRYGEEASDLFGQSSPAYVDDNFTGDGTNKVFTLTHTYADNDTLVVTTTIGGSVVTSVPYTYDSSDNSITLDSEDAPDNGVDVNIVYYQEGSYYSVPLSKHPTEIKSVLINNIEISSSAYTYEDTGNLVTIVLPSDILSRSLSTKVIYKVSGDLITGYRVYFKHANFVIPLATTDQLILVEEVEDNPSVLKMTMTINGRTVQANVLCVNEDGSFPNDLYEQLSLQLETSLSQKFDRVLRWGWLGSMSSDNTDYEPQGTQISGGGTNNYNELSNKPMLNGEVVQGDHDEYYYHLEGYDIIDTEAVEE